MNADTGMHPVFALLVLAAIPAIGHLLFTAAKHVEDARWLRAHGHNRCTACDRDEDQTCPSLWG